jgi:hypothetical protein
MQRAYCTFLQCFIFEFSADYLIFEPVCEFGLIGILANFRSLKLFWFDLLAKEKTA